MPLFNREAVCLIFTDRVIRYLVFSSRKSVQVTDFGEIIFDHSIIEDGRIIDQLQLTTTLKQLIEQKNWKRHKISFIVPDSFVTLREEQIPAQLDKEEAKSFIKLQLDGSIRLPFKNPILDFQVLEEGVEHHRVLLFAYPSDRLLPYYDLFEKLTLQPKVADLSFLSLYRSYLKADLSEPHEHLLVIQWNINDLILTVFNEDIPRFNRHMRFAGSRLNWKKDPQMQQLSWQSSQADLSAFVEDQLLSIERFMDFYQYSIMNGEAQITSCLVVGDFPELELIYQQLSKRFELTPKSLNLPFKLPMAYAPLFGLCLKDENFTDKS